MKYQFVDIDNAREDEQRQVMEKIIKAGHCPFCAENLEKYHTPPTLKETRYWLLTTNKWPYKFTKVHLLAIYKFHAEHLSELKPGAGDELIELMQWAEKEFSVPGGAWAMRFGSTEHSAGTVAHLHVQFISPDIEDPEFKPIKLKIGKG